jgi:hypothetical protein
MSKSIWSLPKGRLCILVLAVACEPAPQSSAYPPERTSYVSVGGPENADFLKISRLTSRIVVPLDRTREELTATLEQAAREFAKESEADAVMVFAYRPGDDPSGMYTAGRAIYAPNGKWEDAGEDGPMQVQVALNELYFASPVVHLAVGDTVSLHSSFGDDVALSREYGTWGDEDIVARVPNGAQAVIVESRSQPMGNRAFVRYRVRSLSAGGRHVGWVHEDVVGAHSLAE